jgi:mRNA interferase RelE/StbE
VAERFDVRLSRQAKRALIDDLPEAVAAACYEFIYGPLADNPRRVGKQLQSPLWPKYSARRGDFRVIYNIADGLLVVEVVVIQHRRDVYRPR